MLFSFLWHKLLVILGEIGEMALLKIVLFIMKSKRQRKWERFVENKGEGDKIELCHYLYS